MTEPHNYFDSVVAERYDDPRDPMFSSDTIDRTTAFLAELANGGRALELAIGTGRIGVPLQRRGVPVSGIELSPDMVARMRAKPGGEDIEVTIGDMATTRVAGDYGLVYLVYNTLVNLLEQDQQVACFRNAAEHLAPGGHFVVEVGVPQVRRLLPGENQYLSQRTDDHLCVDEYDLVGQRMWSHHLSFGEQGPGSVRHNSVPFRYVWPAELDLMARIAGLEPVGRWADWDRRPFTSESRSHVSVWRKPDRPRSG